MTEAWNALVRTLAATGVETIFGLPDDDQGVLAAADAAGVRFVVCRDQRNAVFAASGYALQAGRLGVVAVGKGPAVTNVVTGLLEARSSAVPLLLMAAGTAVQAAGSGAFQELDQVPLVRPLVAHAERVVHPDRLGPALRRALLIAGARSRPVYLEISDGLAGGTVRQPLPLDDLRREATGSVAALEVLRAARRPLILVGGGMRHRNLNRLVERFADGIGAAITCTASGRGVVDEDHPRFLGLAGLYAPLAAAPIWTQADCVLALGSRLEETATYGWPATLGVVQVNIEPADFAADRDGHCVLADAGALLRLWYAALDPSTGPDRTGWLRQVREARSRMLTEVRPAAAPAPGRRDIRELLRLLQQEIPVTRVLVQENGLNDMWSYFYPAYSCGPKGGSIVPSEQTTLGFGAAAAIGARIAAPDRPVVALVGDGAFGMLGNDVLTAVEQAPGLLYVVLHNGGYGWLQHNLDRRPDLAARFAFAEDGRIGKLPWPGCGIACVRVEPEDDMRARVRQAWARCQRGETTVLLVPVDRADAPLTSIDGAFPAAEGATS